MPDRFERLTNLVATLLDTARPLPVEEILDKVPGYPTDRDSARRQFERDKDALRGLGIPLRIEESRWEDQAGYRIDRSEYELPDLELTSEERAALHTAVTAVRLEGGQGREALWKLGGIDGGEAPTLGALPAVPHLPALMEASQRRAPVELTHRGRLRRLDPYAVTFRGGNWYVTGHDHDRDDLRSFRADRIEGDVEVGEAGVFERPAEFDPEAVLRSEPWRYGDEAPMEARLRVDRTVAAWVVERLGHDHVVEERDDELVVRLTVTNRVAFRSFVLGLLDHAVVEEPEELREDLVTWLRALAGEEG